jgi:hypothetical protein
MRRASSLLSNLAADLRPLILEIDIRERLPVVIAHDKACVLFFNGLGRRETARGQSVAAYCSFSVLCIRGEDKSPGLTNCCDHKLFIWRDCLVGGGNIRSFT